MQKKHLLCDKPVFSRDKCDYRAMHELTREAKQHLQDTYEVCSPTCNRNNSQNEIDNAKTWNAFMNVKNKIGLAPTPQQARNRRGAYGAHR